MSAPARPRDLGAAGRKLWASILAAWELSEHELLILADACRQADRAAEARKLIDAEGITVDSGRAGLKPHPAVAIERNAQASVVTLLRSIGITAAAEQTRDRGGRFGTLRAV